MFKKLGELDVEICSLQYYMNVVVNFFRPLQGAHTLIAEENEEYAKQQLKYMRLVAERAELVTEFIIASDKFAWQRRLFESDSLPPGCGVCETCVHARKDKDADSDARTAAVEKHE